VRQAFRHPKTGARCCSFEEITPGFRSPSFFVLIAVIVVSTVISRALTQGFGIQGLPVQNAFLSFHGPGFLSLNRLPSSLYIDQELPPEDAEKKDMANLKAITDKMSEAVLASSRRTG
jgi:hypothetical protein